MPIKEPGLTWTNKNELHGSLIRPSGQGLRRAEQALDHHRRPIIRRISTFCSVSGTSAALAFVVFLAVLGGMALGAQDRFTLKVPNGLAFSDFRGYETWRDVAVSQTENGLKSDRGITR
jgi:hypothetical protein